MRPQSAKSKGRRHQQRLVEDILKAFPHLQPDDVRSTSMGCPGIDILLSTAAKESLPLSIEAKNCEKLSIWAALEQCESNTAAGTTGCVVFTRNRAKTYAALPWDLLLDLFKRCQSGGSGQLPPRLGRLLRELATYAPPPESCEADE